jgi:hypothetical protein
VYSALVESPYFGKAERTFPRGQFRIAPGACDTPGDDGSVKARSV